MMICRAAVAVAVAMLVLSIAGAEAQERWAGRWADAGTGQGGTLEFVVTNDGAMTGRITNGGVVGSWNGVVQGDGVMVAEYAYRGFAARAVGRIVRQADDHVGGRMAFVQGDRVFAEGEFDLRRVGAAAGGAPSPYEGAYPFTGGGLSVYCSAPSVCGQRGGNALPGNWGWTSGLFGDIKRNYPHVWCNLYPGSC